MGGLNLGGKKGERKEGDKDCASCCKVILNTNQLAAVFWINVVENLSMQGKLYKDTTY